MTSQETSDPQKPTETTKEHSPRQENEQLPIGKLLRQAREKKALTISDISQETYISSSNLTSIELGNYNDLPADTFIRGQIIIYANFLGLDGPEAARLFFEERARRVKNKEGKQFNQQGNGMATKNFAEPAHISSATWAVTLLLLILTFLAFFSWYTGWNPFGYLFEKKPASVSITASTDHPGKLEPDIEAEMLSSEDISEEIAERSAIHLLPATGQEPEQTENNSTVEQDIAH